MRHVTVKNYSQGISGEINGEEFTQVDFQGTSYLIREPERIEGLTDSRELIAYEIRRIVHNPSGSPTVIARGRIKDRETLKGVLDTWVERFRFGENV